MLYLALQHYVINYLHKPIKGIAQTVTVARKIIYLADIKQNDRVGKCTCACTFSEETKDNNINKINVCENPIKAQKN